MGGAYPLRQCAVMDKEEQKHMDRVEEARRTLLALYGGSHSPLEESDPDFAAIKQRLVYGELYAQEALDPVMRELILLAVSTTNQTMFEVKLHPVPHCGPAHHQRQSRRPSITAHLISGLARQRPLRLRSTKFCGRRASPSRWPVSAQSPRRSG